MAARTVPGWLRGGGGDQRATAALIAELEAELALLREENARLKVERARAARSWDARVHGTVPGATADGAGEDVWELMTECEVLRTALLDVCRDVDHALDRIRGRLGVQAGETPRQGEEPWAAPPRS